jgi:hypothetical protein
MIRIVEANRSGLLRRALAIAIVLGVLLFPATCSHAAGPHSLFIDPRQTTDHDPDQHASLHPDHRRHLPPERPARHETASAAGHPGGTPAWSGLPDVMQMSMLAGGWLLVTPQAMELPVAPAPGSLRAAPTLRGTPVSVDVPPPRALVTTSAAA